MNRNGLRVKVRQLIIKTLVFAFQGKSYIYIKWTTVVNVRCFSFDLQGTKLWIIMEYLGGGSALDLVSTPFKYVSIVLCLSMS